MRNKVLLWGIFIFTSPAFAQAGWWRTYGGAEDDYGYSVQQTSDGGYIVAGKTGSFGAGSHDVYLIRTNAQGDTLWTRTFGGADADGGFSVQQTLDGGYIVAGFAASFGAGEPEVYLIKTDAQGDTQWTRTYGGPGYEYGSSVQQTSDGGYVVAGTKGLLFYADVYVIKTDSQGDTVWTRTYGGTGEDRGNSVQQTLDGGYIVAGFTSSFGPGDEDVYLIKTNDSGDTVWTRTYGGTSNDEGFSVRQTSDGGYIIAGSTASFGAGTRDVYLIRVDTTGDTLWTRTCGGMGDDLGYSVQQAADGGYIVAGCTRSFGTGYTDVYLIMTDAAGDTLWTRTYGGTTWDFGNSVQQTLDGGYIIAGWTYSFGGGLCKVYLIKTDANGNVGIAEPSARHLPDSSAPLLVQPNPCRGLLRVRLDQAASLSPLPIAVCNAAGRCVRRFTLESSGPFELDLRDVPDGVYFLSAPGNPACRFILSR
jgi:hypothetical protein